MEVLGIKGPDFDCLKEEPARYCLAAVKKWLNSDEGDKAMAKANDATSSWTQPLSQHHHAFLLANAEAERGLIDLLNKQLSKGKEVEHLLKLFSGFGNIRDAAPECEQLMNSLMKFTKQFYMELSKPGITKETATKGESFLEFSPDYEELSLMKKTGDTASEKKTVSIEKDILVTFELAQTTGLSEKCPAKISSEPLTSALLFTKADEDRDVAKRGYEGLFEYAAIPEIRPIITRFLTGTSLITDMEKLTKRIDSYLDDASFDELHWHYLLINDSRNLGIDRGAMELNLRKAIIESSRLCEHDKKIALLWTEYGPKGKNIEEVSQFVWDSDGMTKYTLEKFKDLTGISTNEISFVKELEDASKGFKVILERKEIFDKIRKSIKASKYLRAWLKDNGMIDDALPDLSKYEDVFELQENWEYQEWYDIHVKTGASKNDSNVAKKEALKEDLQLFEKHPILRDFDYDDFDKIKESCELDRKYTVGSKKAIMAALLYASKVIDQNAMLKAQLRGFNLTTEAFYLHFGDRIRDIADADEGSYSSNSSRIFLDSLLRLRDANTLGFEVPIEKSKLNDLVSLMAIFNASSYFNHDSQVNKLLIEGMEPKDKLYLAAAVQGHALSFEIIRSEDDSYEVTFFNSGSGIKFHQQVGDGRRIYYKKMVMNREQLRQAGYFIAPSIDASIMDKFFFAATAPNNITSETMDSVSGQKSDTCAIKSVSYLIKWFLRDTTTKYARYDWFKTWILLSHLSKEILENLKREDLKFEGEDYDDLYKEWKVPGDCDDKCEFEETKELLFPIIRHAVLRRLALAREYAKEETTETIRLSMLAMLEKIMQVVTTYDEDLYKCYKCILKKDSIKSKEAV